MSKNIFTRKDRIERLNSRISRYKVEFKPKDASKKASGPRYQNNTHFETFNRLSSFQYLGIEQ